jgi:hypothetical protein
MTAHKSEGPGGAEPSANQITNTRIVVPAQKTDKFPIAETRAVRSSDGVWALTVAVCPICFKQHFHGGGKDAEPTLGHRVAHCRGVNYFRDLGYILQLVGGAA